MAWYTAERPVQPMGAEADRAAPRVLDQVYAALLGDLTLSDAHRENLRGRGLSDVEISRRGYRTLPPRDRSRLARQLAERFGPEVCGRVPGLYVKSEAGRYWWSVAGRAGLLIPTRNLAGQIVALRLRADEPPGSGERYSWLSSTRHGGPGSGAQPHVPLYDCSNTQTVRLTEGELKADVTTALSRMLTISVPGVSCYRSALPILADLGAVTIQVAFDADYATNPHVAGALYRAAVALEDEGYDVLIETWNEEGE